MNEKEIRRDFERYDGFGTGHAVCGRTRLMPRGGHELMNEQTPGLPEPMLHRMETVRAELGALGQR